MAEWQNGGMAEWHGVGDITISNLLSGTADVLQWCGIQLTLTPFPLHAMRKRGDVHGAGSLHSSACANAMATRAIPP